MKADLAANVAQPVEETEPEHTSHGVFLATLVGLAPGGRCLVQPNGAPAAVPARSAVVPARQDIGRQVALMYEGGDPQRPLVIGLVESADCEAPETAKLKTIEIDGEQLVFTAEREIVLKCGKAKITLTRSGKVLIRGAYLLNRSSGVNRIKGGSVQIN